MLDAREMVADETAHELLARGILLIAVRSCARDAGACDGDVGVTRRGMELVARARC